MPARPDDVALYLASAAVQNKAPATIERWSAAIAAVHTAYGLPVPTTQEPAAGVLAAVRQRTNSGRRLRTPTLSEADFHRVLSALPPDTWPEAALSRRDRLILTLGRATGLSPEALLSLHVNSISQYSESTIQVAGDADPLLLDMDDAPVPLAWRAFLQWRVLLDVADSVSSTGLQRLAAHGDIDELLAAEPDPTSPPAQRPDGQAWLLRSVRRGGAIQTERPHPSLVMRIVQKYARTAGLDPAGLNAFSLRDH